MRYRGSQGFSLGAIGFLIIANILMFIVTFIRPDLIYELGMAPVIFWDRPWTILTSIFVHVGFGHILANMITLFFFGGYLIRLLGERHFLIVYSVGRVLVTCLDLMLASPFSIS